MPFDTLETLFRIVRGHVFSSSCGLCSNPNLFLLNQALKRVMPCLSVTLYNLFVKVFFSVLYDNAFVICAYTLTAEVVNSTVVNNDAIHLNSTYAAACA